MKKILIFVAILLGVVDITIAGLILASASVKTVKEAKIENTEKGSRVVLTPLFEESETEKISLKKRISIILGDLAEIKKKDAENVPIDKDWNVDPRFDYILTINPYFGKKFEYDVVFDYRNAILLKDHNRERILKIFTRREIDKPINAFKINKGLGQEILYIDRSLTQPIIDKVPDVKVMYCLDKTVASKNYTITYKYESKNGQNIPKEKLGFDNPIKGKAIENQKIPVKIEKISGYTVEKEIDSFVVDEIDKQVFIVYKHSNENEVTVQFKVNDQIVDTISIPKNTTIAKPTNFQAPEGYVIANWTVNGIVFDFTKPINSDITLVAVLEKDIAKFAKVDFEVQGNIEKSIEVLKGKKITKPTDIQPPAGMKITGWTHNGVDFTFEEIITGYTKLVAKLEKDVNKYVKVTFKYGENTLEKEFLKGSVISVPKEIKAPDGFEITGWKLNDQLFDFTSQVNTNITLVAVLESNEYVVTFFVKGEVKLTQKVLKNNLVQEPTDITVPDGYILRGWLLDDKDYDFSKPVTSNIRLNAKLERDPNKIVLVQFEMRNAIVKRIEIPINTKVDEPTDILPPENFILKYWMLYGDPYSFEELVEQDITLVAALEEDPAKQAKVEFYVNNMFETHVWVVKGNKITIPSDIVVPEGYNITGWKLNGEIFNLETLIHENIRLDAVLEKDPTKFYQVQFKVNEEIVKTVDVLKGKTIEQPTDITAPTGFEITGWKLNEEKITFPYIVNDNITFIAILELKELKTFEVKFIVNYTVVKTLNVKENEKVSEPQPTEFTVEEGYHIVDWLLNATHYDFNQPVTDNLFLIAKIEKDLTKWATYKFVMNGNTEITNEVLKGSEVQNPGLYPPFGYEIVGWKVNGEFVTFPYVINEDVTFVAELQVEVIEYTVRFFVKNEVKKELKVPKETILTEPNDIEIPEGYIFKGWLFHDDPYTFTVPVTSHMDLHADLERDPEKMALIVFYINDEVVDNKDVLINTKLEYPAHIIPNPSTHYGYHIDYWLDEYNQKFDFDTLITRDMKLHAHLAYDSSKYVKLTFIMNHKIVKEYLTDKGKILEQAPYIPTPIGYDFVEWQKDGVAYVFGQPVNEDLTLVAKLNLQTENYFDVTYIVRGEIYLILAVNKGLTAQNIPLYIPGYSYVWQKDGADFDFETHITSDLVLVAKLTPKEFTITYVLGEGVTNSPENPELYNVETDDIILKPATKQSFTFLGWYKDSTLVQEVAVIKKGTLGNIKLYPKFGTLLDKFNDTKDVKEIINILKNPEFGLTVNGELPTDEYYREKTYEDFANNKIYKNLKFENIEQINEIFNKLNEFRKLNQEIVNLIVTGNQPTSHLVKFNEQLNHILGLGDIYYEGNKQFQELINMIEKLITEKYNILNETAKADSNKFIEKYQKQFGHKLTIEQLTKVFNMALDDLLNTKYTVYLAQHVDTLIYHKYKYGQIILEEHAITSRIGYKLKHFIVSDTEEVFNINQDPVVRSMTLVSKWELEYYSISYVLNGGKVLGNNPSSYSVEDYDKLNNLIKPTKEGLSFVTWYLNPEFTKIFEPKNKEIFTKPGIVLYAKFENLAKAFENINSNEDMKAFINERKDSIDEYDKIVSYDDVTLSYFYEFLRSDIKSYYSTGHGPVETFSEFNTVIYYNLLAFNYFHSEFFPKYKEAKNSGNIVYINKITTYYFPVFWETNNMDFSFDKYVNSLSESLEKLYGPYKGIIIDEFAKKVLQMPDFNNPFELYEKLYALSIALEFSSVFSKTKNSEHSQLQILSTHYLKYIKEYLNYFETTELVQKFEKILGNSNVHSLENLKDIAYLIRFEKYNNDGSSYLVKLVKAIENYVSIKEALISSISKFNNEEAIELGFYQELYDSYSKILKKPEDNSWFIDIYVSNLVDGDSFLNIINFETYQKMHLINKLLQKATDESLQNSIINKLFTKRASMGVPETKNINKILNAYKEILDTFNLENNLTGLDIINLIDYQKDFGRDFLIALQKPDINVSSISLIRYSELSAIEQEKITKYIVFNKPIAGYSDGAFVKKQFENMTLAGFLLKEFNRKRINKELDSNLGWLNELVNNYPIGHAYVLEIENFESNLYSIASILNAKKKEIILENVYKSFLSPREILNSLKSIIYVMLIGRDDPENYTNFNSKFNWLLGKAGRNLNSVSPYYQEFIKYNIAATIYSLTNNAGTRNTFDIELFTYLFDEYKSIAILCDTAMTKFKSVTTSTPNYENPDYFVTLLNHIYPKVVVTYRNLKFHKKYSKDNFGFDLSSFVSRFYFMTIESRRNFMSSLILSNFTEIHNVVKYLVENIRPKYEEDKLYLLNEGINHIGKFDKFMEFLNNSSLNYVQYTSLDLVQRKFIHKMISSGRYNYSRDYLYDNEEQFRSSLLDYVSATNEEKALLNSLSSAYHYDKHLIERIRVFAEKIYTYNLGNYSGFEKEQYRDKLLEFYNTFAYLSEEYKNEFLRRATLKKNQVGEKLISYLNIHLYPILKEEKALELISTTDDSNIIANEILNNELFKKIPIINSGSLNKNIVVDVSKMIKKYIQNIEKFVVFDKFVSYFVNAYNFKNEISKLDAHIEDTVDISGHFEKYLSFFEKYKELVYDEDEIIIEDAINKIRSYIETMKNKPKETQKLLMYDFCYKANEFFHSDNGLSSVEDTLKLIINYSKTIIEVYDESGIILIKKYDFDLAEKIIIDNPENKPGYRFKGWASKNNNDLVDIYLIVYGYYEIRPIYELIDYKINYYGLEEQEFNETFVKNYNLKTPIFNLPVINREGYVFEGWYTNPNYEGEKVVVIDSSTFTEGKEINLYAKFRKV